MWRYRNLVAVGCALWALGAGAQQSRPFNLFYFPTGIVADSRDNLYVCGLNHKIIRISPAAIATDFAGNPGSAVGHRDGPGAAARFDSPREMAIDTDDNIYVTEEQCICKVTPAGNVTTLAGNKGPLVKDGPVATACFRRPGYISVDGDRTIYVTDLEVDQAGQPAYDVIRTITPAGEVSTLKGRDGGVVRLNAARGLACDRSGNLFVCDLGDRCIKRIARDGVVTVVAGQCGTRRVHPVYQEGDVGTAELMTPRALAVEKDGALVFSDERLNRIIRVAGGRVETIAGNSPINHDDANIMGYSEAGYADGKAKLALFNGPDGITFDSRGNLFIVDQGNQCIRKLSPEGTVSTFYK